MKIVIDISEEDYNSVKKQVADGITNPLKICIANGTPLPKGHGRLIDADSMKTLKNIQSANISIDDVMSVFDDFMCGEVDEDGMDTFLEMLKDKAESEV